MNKRDRMIQSLMKRGLSGLVLVELADEQLEALSRNEAKALRWELLTLGEEDCELVSMGLSELCQLQDDLANGKSMLES